MAVVRSGRARFMERGAIMSANLNLIQSEKNEEVVMQCYLSNSPATRLTR